MFNIVNTVVFVSGINDACLL